MIGEIRWRARQIADVANGRYDTIREPRQGVLLHYDGSGSDEAALRWFDDPRCTVSYQFLAFDDGTWASIAPIDRRAWHAGICRPSDPRRIPYDDANSAFIGIAAATDNRREVTGLQLLTVAWLCWLMFRQYGWEPEETWRIRGHDQEAWPRGRKIDPTGHDTENPVLSVKNVRQLVGLFV